MRDNYKKYNPFYEHGKNLVAFGECLMKIDTSINEVAERAHKCGLTVAFVVDRKEKQKSLRIAKK
jgi:hypothetical protein